MRLIYVVQFDGWWSLTPTRWQGLIRDHLAGMDWNLDNYGRRLLNPPAGMTKPFGARRWERPYHPNWPHKLVQMPCDWDEEQWLEAQADEVGKPL